MLGTSAGAQEMLVSRSGVMGLGRMSGTKLLAWGNLERLADLLAGLGTIAKGPVGVQMEREGG